MKRKVTVSKMIELIEKAIVVQKEKVERLAGDNPQIVKMREEAQVRLEAFQDVRTALAGSFYVLDF